MKRKTEDERITLNKRKKANIEDEEVYKELLRKKSFKELKDELSEKSRNSSLDFSTITKEEVVEKLVYNFVLLIKLPQDVKFHIFEYLTLVITEEDITQMESYEKKIKEGTKPNSKDINYVKHFYGYYRNMKSPFIVFKNLIFDYRMMNHIKIDQIFTNVIPFTNSSMNYNQLDFVDRYGKNQHKVFKLIQKHVKDQYIQMHYNGNDKDLVTKNISRLDATHECISQQYKHLTHYTNRSYYRFNEIYDFIKYSPLTTISTNIDRDLDLISTFEGLETLIYTSLSFVDLTDENLRIFNSLRVKTIKLQSFYSHTYPFITPSTLHLILECYWMNEYTSFDNFKFHNLETVTFLFGKRSFSKSLKTPTLNLFKKIVEKFPKLKLYSNVKLSKKEQQEYSFIGYADEFEFE